MDFEQIVRSILEPIPKDFVFDSHFVIKQLIMNHSDEYLRFAAQYCDGKAPTLTTHQQIGQVIKGFDASLVERLPYQSWSMTIHCTPGECALWRRK